MLASYLLTGFSLSSSLAFPVQERADAAVTVDYNNAVDATAFNSIFSSVPAITQTLDEVVYVTAAPVTVTVIQWVESPESASDGATDGADSGVSNDQQTGSYDVSSNTSPPYMSSTETVHYLSFSSCSSKPVKTTGMTTSSAPASETITLLTSSSARVTLLGQDLPTSTIIQNLQPSDAVYSSLALFAHNIHRANHSSTEPLQYNMTLEQFAREKVLSCVWDETVPGEAQGIGMNMAEGTFIGAANVTGIIEDMWYNDEINLFPGYDDASPDMSNFQNWGHFTQVVWRATTSMGCWSAPCGRNDGIKNAIGSGFFTVCTYFPPGNVGGEYDRQIGRPEGQPTIHGN